MRMLKQMASHFGPPCTLHIELDGVEHLSLLRLGIRDGVSIFFKYITTVEDVEVR